MLILLQFEEIQKFIGLSTDNVKVMLHCNLVTFWKKLRANISLSQNIYFYINSIKIDQMDMKKRINFLLIRHDFLEFFENFERLQNMFNEKFLAFEYSVDGEEDVTLLLNMEIQMKNYLSSLIEILVLLLDVIPSQTSHASQKECDVFEGVELRNSSPNATINEKFRNSLRSSRNTILLKVINNDFKNL